MKIFEGARVLHLNGIYAEELSERGHVVVGNERLDVERAIRGANGVLTSV